MKKNIIYIFTGTGNSLKAARNIANELGNCDIVSMGNNTIYELEKGYETIGFVFPTYYRGEPGKVNQFIKHLNLQQNKNAYYYAITTMGKYDGNTLNHIMKLLKKKGITLNYAKALDMFSNYVISYDMKDTIDEETKQSEIDNEKIIQDLKERKNNKVNKIEPIQEIIYKSLIKFVPQMDKFYNVSEDCIQCGICEKVCPVGNISMDESGHPIFNHHCEQCLACIQFCPKKAINYKDRTQDRKRYHHPAIGYSDLAALNYKNPSQINGSLPESVTPIRNKHINTWFSGFIANIVWKIYGM
jgi:ferredoxin